MMVKLGLTPDPQSYTNTTTEPHNLFLLHLHLYTNRLLSSAFCLFPMSLVRRTTLSPSVLDSDALRCWLYHLAATRIARSLRSLALSPCSRSMKVSLKGKMVVINVKELQMQRVNVFIRKVLKGDFNVRVIRGFIFHHCNVH